MRGIFVCWCVCACACACACACCICICLHTFACVSVSVCVRVGEWVLCSAFKRCWDIADDLTHALLVLLLVPPTPTHINFLLVAILALAGLG